ncbi:exopolysaccharide biosynthesis polyprenyl glycosylphosphotransferase [Ruminococcaceae bacterium YRB3002]|nr:exopolysaccharide biosynthesis polyprenyl glycosylphosphotransferase [Ruminococcaceae bacterium YRB3002]
MTTKKYNFRHEVGLRLIKLFNVCLIVLPFIAAWYFYYSPRLSTPYYIKGDIVITGIFVLLYYIFGKTYDAFLISLNKLSETVVSQMLSALLANGILYMVFFLLMKKIPNPLPLILVWVCQFLLSLIWTVIARAIYFKWFPAKKSIVIYDMRQGMESLISEYGLTKKFEIAKTASVSECLADISMIDDMEVVFLSGVRSHDRNVILKYCLYNSKTVYMIPRIGDVIMSSAKTMHMFHLPVMRVTRYNPNPVYLIAKRVFDIVVSIAALIVLSPVFLVTAIAIKATDKGPVFYKQERLTKNGKRFMIHKFRSMRVDAEKDGVARLSTGENDDRITPVGRFIRKCRIDELPQLIDILAGNLSVVGPRPERPEIAADYVKEMPEFQLRLQAKAGLTGFAQVYGKYNTTPYDKLQMDLMYIAHPSFIEDLRICFATIKILFMPESTEGVAEGQTTAMASPAEEKAS